MADLSVFFYILLKTDCNTPVGVEDRRITDEQMTASSQDDHSASNARLHNKRSISSSSFWGAWCTDKKDIHQYLQVTPVRLLTDPLYAFKGAVSLLSTSFL